MNQEQWNAVDSYITDLLTPPDPVLDATLKASAAAGLPDIQVSPAQGKFLMLLAQMQGARTILEIGTLGGYSTIWLARALPPGGRVLTIEFDPKHAAVARANFAHAGLSDIIDLRVGAALDILPHLERGQCGPFDFAFLDADKANNANYFSWALKLSRPGTVIVADNVVRNGAVLDSRSTDPSVQGIRKLYELMATEARVTATAIQTVGSKGYDGFAIARVLR